MDDSDRAKRNARRMIKRLLKSLEERDFAENWTADKLNSELRQDTIISDCRLVDAEGCPQYIRDAQDEPWTFIGEVRTNSRLIQCICDRCTPKAHKWVGGYQVELEPFRAVALQAHRFITDCMIEVLVFWGRCEQCQRVHWARSGPPFKRARAYVPKTTGT